MRINFDFADLEAFLAVMETASFHAAAHQLNLSQSSVSRRVQKLEAALDSPLFERTTRDVRPTLAAKRLQERAGALLEDARETTRALRDESAAFAHQRARTVTLATIPTVVADLLAPALPAFRLAQPRVRLRILDLAANDVAEAVAQGDADFGLCSIPLLEPATKFELLFTDPMVLALSPRHPLAAREALCWADLSGETLILPARGTGNRLTIDDALARSDLPVTWTFEVGRSSTALDLVAAGVGLAPLPRTAITADAERRVTSRPITGPTISRPVGVLRRVGHAAPPAVAAMIVALRAAVPRMGGAPGHE